MSGQPLAKFNDVNHLSFAPGSVFQRPSLAPHVMLVIEQWSFTEARILLILKHCLGGDPTVTSAVLLSIDSQAAQRSAILAAAKAVLNEEYGLLFQSSFLSTLASRNTRHRFAHHLWGVSDDLPDALLLQDPKDFHTALAQRVKRVAAREKAGIYPAGEDVRSLDRSGMSVWRERDFLEEVDAAKRADTVVAHLESLVASVQNGSSVDSILQWLLKDPLIQQRLQKAKTQT